MRDHTGMELTKAGKIIHGYLLKENASYETTIQEKKRLIDKTGVYYHPDCLKSTNKNGTNYYQVCILQRKFTEVGNYYIEDKELTLNGKPIKRNFNNTRTYELIKEIKIGGMIYAPRAIGKTTAALKVLEDNKQFIYVTIKLYAKELKKSYPSLANRIFSFDSIVGIKGKELDIYKIIIDEYAWVRPAMPIWLYNKAHTVITSPNKRTVVYTKNNSIIINPNEDVREKGGKNARRYR